MDDVTSVAGRPEVFPLVGDDSDQFWRAMRRCPIQSPRFEKFSGEWTDMFLESAVCDEKATVVQASVMTASNRAEMLAQLGELSSARVGGSRVDRRELQTTSAKGPHSTRTLSPCFFDRIQVGH